MPASELRQAQARQSTTLLASIMLSTRTQRQALLQVSTDTSIFIDDLLERAAGRAGGQEQSRHKAQSASACLTAFVDMPCLGQLLLVRCGKRLERAAESFKAAAVGLGAEAEDSQCCAWPWGPRPGREQLAHLSACFFSSGHVLKIQVRVCSHAQDPPAGIDLYIDPVKAVVMLQVQGRLLTLMMMGKAMAVVVAMEEEESARALSP